MEIETFFVKKDELLELSELLTLNTKCCLNENIAGHVICPAGFVIEVNDDTRPGIEAIRKWRKEKSANG